MFTHKKVSQLPRRRSYALKYMTMFFLGASVVMLAVQAFDISTSLNNAVQYIAQIVLTDNGTNLGATGVFIDGSNGGKIGIGTDSPLYQLQVNGASGYVGIYNTFFGGSSWASLILNSDLGNFTGFQIAHVLGAAFLTNRDGPIGLATAGIQRMVIDAAGNVGIGTSSPSYTLDVSGTTNIQNNLYVYNNVGIGTTGPTAQLDIKNNAGRILIDAGIGRITINNNTSTHTGLIISQGPFQSQIRDQDSDLYLQSKTSYMVLTTSGKVGIGMAPSAMLTVNGGIKPKSLSVTYWNICTTNPTEYPEGTIFYNNTSGYVCYCNAGGSAARVSDNGSCY